MITCNENKEIEELFSEFSKTKLNLKFTGKNLGKGGFGEVKEVQFNNKMCAAKIIKVKEEIIKSKKNNEIMSIINLRNPNIIKHHQIYEIQKGNNYYYLIIMEKAVLRDLGKFNNFTIKNNLLKQINKPFIYEISEGLLKFYVTQILGALLELYKQETVHFDIKLENILITNNLKLKLSDFSLVKILDEINDNEKVTLPGGTLGYLTPEYYLKDKLPKKQCFTQDYFDLGLCIIEIKYGYKAIKIKENYSKQQSYNKTILSLEDAKNFVESKKYESPDLKKFIKRLISPEIDKRPSFYEIYSSKWLNNNIDYINNLIPLWTDDEEKLLQELQKSDFIFDKEKSFKEAKQLNILKQLNCEKNKFNKIEKKTEKFFLYSNKKFRVKFKHSK